MKPTLRKPLGMLLLLFFILVWCLFFASQLERIMQWPFLLQLPAYIIAGIAWIFPVKPLMRWIETGKWRE